MLRHPMHGRHVPLLACLLAAVWTLIGSSPAAAQIRSADLADLQDRPIAEVRLQGLDRVDEQLVRNQLRTAVGDPFDPSTVRSDMGRLERLGGFQEITPEVVLLEDGSVAVTFRLVEQPIVEEIQIVGNRLVADRDLRALIRLRPGGPQDDFLIEEAIRRMREEYRERGHFLTDVRIDEQELEETGVLVFRVIEGPRVRVRAVEFEGNDAFTDRQLSAEIGTRTAIFLFRRGELDEQQISEDIASINEFYRDRGYLDVRVDRRIEISPDNREAIITFLVDEGQQYRLRSVDSEPMGSVNDQQLEVFAREQIAAMIEIRPGDVYSRGKIRRSLDVVRRAYNRLGYVDVETRTYEVRTGDEPFVDLVIEIHEGQKGDVGLITIAGNTLTKDKVIRREMRHLQPGRPLDSAEIEEAERRIRNTRLFNDVRITVQDPEPEDPERRDILVEVQEANTGSVNFGAAVGSDAGVLGQFSVQQDNFDIADFPESFGELIRGRAFRGAGQQFSFALEPGNRISTYSVNFTEPHLFDTDTSLNVGAFLRDRVFRRYDEDRRNLTLGLGRRFGDIWRVNLNTRFERIELSDIDERAAVDVFDARGPDTITSGGLSLVRSTVGTIHRPGRGSRLELSLDQAGLMGGDHTFTSASAEHTIFLTLDEDFLGRRSILRLNSRASYIFAGDSPVYERFYLGGRSFRGFAFREISPKGIRADTGEIGNDPVGGDWLLFLGAQYEVPLWEEMLTGVVFVDSGTVTDSPGIDDFRVSVGTGVRLYIPAFGPAPIAFDLAVPVKRRPGDRSQLFSFSAELPF